MSNLVLWGHQVSDYQEMFDLTETDFQGRILEYCSGPSAINAELKNIAKECVSADPLFCLDFATLKSKTSLIFAEMAEQVVQEVDKFNFQDYGNLDGLIKERQAGMAIFFADYLAGKKEGRYLPLTDLPLPFNPFHFDIALSSHYLFGQIEELDLDFHLRVIHEVTKVAKEFRIFPLIDRWGQPSPFLGPVLLKLQQENYGVEVRSIQYSLQPKGNAMLRVWAQECTL